MSDSDGYNCSSDSHSNKNNSCSIAPVIVREGGNEESETNQMSGMGLKYLCNNHLFTGPCSCPALNGTREGRVGCMRSCLNAL